MSIILFTIIAILFIADASCQEPVRKFSSYSILDRVSIIFNVFLAMAYLSVYVMSNLMFMVNGESFHNQFVGLTNIFHLVEFIVPLVCVISIALSVKWRKIGKSIEAFWIQFFPLVIFPFKYFFK
jgi:hypothetical protein